MTKHIADNAAADGVGAPGGSSDASSQHAAQGSAAAARTGRDDLRSFDLPAFIRARRETRGTVRLGELERMVTETPSDAPVGALDEVLQWQAKGEFRREQGVARPCLTLEIRGRVWLECQRCMTAFEFPVNIDTLYIVTESDKQADEIALDDSDVEVIVGSQTFDLIDLIDEEIVLSVPMVPKHDVCPVVHQSVVSGVDGSLGVDSVEDIEARVLAADAEDVDAFDLDTVEDDVDPVIRTGGAETAAKTPNGSRQSASGKPNPFAALAGLRKTLAGEDRSEDEPQGKPPINGGAKKPE
jgi:uncharacterized protein